MFKPNRNSRSEKRKNTPQGCVFFSGCGDGIWTSWPPGYEPGELPDCSTPRYYGAGSRGRTGTRNKSHGILSPGRLPIPPFRHLNDLWTSTVLIYYTTTKLKSQYFLKHFLKKSFFNIDIMEKVCYHIWAPSYTLLNFMPKPWNYSGFKS